MYQYYWFFNPLVPGSDHICVATEQLCQSIFVCILHKAVQERLCSPLQEIGRFIYSQAFFTGTVDGNFFFILQQFGNYYKANPLTKLINNQSSKKVKFPYQTLGCIIKVNVYEGVQLKVEIHSDTSALMNKHDIQT